MVTKEDLGNYQYCCKTMESAILKDIVRCDPHSGEHYIYAWHIPAEFCGIFIQHCPFCGSATFKKEGE